MKLFYKQSTHIPSSKTVIYITFVIRQKALCTSMKVYKIVFPFI